MHASARKLLLPLALIVASCAHDAGRAPVSGESPEFRDCPVCPVLLRIPAGRFAMGSPPAETDGRGWPAQTGGNERPVHEVAIGAAFALGKYEVTRGQYAAFIAATGRADTGGCIDFRSGFINTKAIAARNWRDPGFEQSEIGRAHV